MSVSNFSPLAGIEHTFLVGSGAAATYIGAATTYMTTGTVIIELPQSSYAGTRLSLAISFLVFINIVPSSLFKT